jgi:hypothetical protein
MEHTHRLKICPRSHPVGGTLRITSSGQPFVGGARRLIHLPSLTTSSVCACANSKRPCCKHTSRTNHCPTEPPRENPCGCQSRHTPRLSEAVVLDIEVTSSPPIEVFSQHHAHGQSNNPSRVKLFKPNSYLCCLRIMLLLPTSSRLPQVRHPSLVSISTLLRCHCIRTPGLFVGNHAHGPSTAIQRHNRVTLQ